MKPKYVRVSRTTYVLVVVASSLLVMATSVYGFLGEPVLSWETHIKPKSLPESPPLLTAPESVIPANSAVLKKVYQKAAEINSISSLLVQKKGKLIVEDYFKKMEKDGAVNVKSVSKSILSLLVGIALEKGILKSKSQPIRNYFPEYLSKNGDDRKGDITIEDLLTMRAGLKTTSFSNYARWVSSDNWVQYALKQPLVEEPGGQKMVYSTGSSHLLSVILTKASGMSTRDFAEQYLFEPLDIKISGWPRDPQGYYLGGNNMYLKPVDMMKIGQMILNNGYYNDKKIISQEWLEDSFRSYTQSNNNSNDYGYMWWKQEIRGYESVFACGYGGQYLFIIPELESVVAITSDLDYATDERRYHGPIFKLMEETVIPELLLDRPQLHNIMPVINNFSTAIAR